MAQMEIKVKVLDMPEVQALLKRYKKINKRRAWKNKPRTRQKKRGWRA